MHIRDAFSSKVSLNVATTDSEGMLFKPGEIIAGLVEAVTENNLIQISLKGISIEANTEVELRPGQQLHLYVDGFREGRVYLRVVSPQLMENIENRNIAATLSNMGVKAGEEAVVAARKLIQHNLPVTREYVNQLLKGATLLGGINPRNLEITAFALSHGIQISAYSLPALREFLESPRNVARLLQETLQRLQEARDPVPTTANATLTSQPDRATSADNILLPAQQPARAATQAGETLILMPASDGGKLPTFLARGLPLLEPILNTLIASLVVELEGTPEVIAARLREVLGAGPEVARALVLLREVLGFDREMQNHPVIKEMLTSIQGAEHQLGGQQLLNGLERLNYNHSQPYYYFAIPVELNGDHRLCQLRVYREGGGSKNLGKADEIRMSVALETIRLGTVLFHVTYYRGGALYLQGVVEREGTRAYLEKSLPHLIRALKGLGYEVTAGDIKVAAARELSLRPQLTETTGKTRPLGIDIRI